MIIMIEAPTRLVSVLKKLRRCLHVIEAQEVVSRTPPPTNICKEVHGLRRRKSRLVHYTSSDSYVLYTRCLHEGIDRVPNAELAMSFDFLGRYLANGSAN